MNKIVKNALDKAREILKSNTLSETARQLFDEFVAAVDALAEDAAEHNETSIKDEFEKVAAKYATTEEVAEMIARVRESIANDVRKNVSVADKFTPQVKNAIVQAFATSRDKREVMNKLQEIAKENGIELKKRKNDVSGLTYQGMVDYAIAIKQDESDEIYDALYKTPVSKIFFAELDDTNPEEIAKQWSKNPAPNVVKDVQALAAEGKEMTTANVYKMQRIANEDLDDAAEVGQEGALIGTITAELRKAVKAGIVRAILIGDDINPEGKKITKFETIGTKTATDLFTTVLHPEQAAGQVTIIDLARAAEAVKTERKWLFLSPELDLALREYVYATGGTPMLMSREELAAKIGVDRIFKKDYIAGVEGLHAIILDPDQYWVKEKKETDVAFPQYERNARGFLYELNAGGIIRGLKSTAVLKEAK